MVTKDGKPWFVVRRDGRRHAAAGHVQVLVNLIDFGMNVQEAGEAPRVEHVGSRDADRHAAATPTAARSRRNPASRTTW